MLHALSGDLANVRDHVATALSSSTKEAPFTSSDICKRLDTEQQILDSDRLMHATSETLTVHPARPSGTKSRKAGGKCCGNCGGSTHSDEECFMPGGAMEGCKEEVMANRKKCREAREAGKLKPKCPASSKSVQHDGRTVRRLPVSPVPPHFFLLFPMALQLSVISFNLARSFLSMIFHRRSSQKAAQPHKA